MKLKILIKFLLLLSIGSLIVYLSFGTISKPEIVILLIGSLLLAISWTLLARALLNTENSDDPFYTEISYIPTKESNLLPGDLYKRLRKAGIQCKKTKDSISLILTSNTSISQAYDAHGCMCMEGYISTT